MLFSGIGVERRLEVAKDRRIVDGETRQRDRNDRAALVSRRVRGARILPDKRKVVVAAYREGDHLDVRLLVTNHLDGVGDLVRDDAETGLTALLIRGQELGAVMVVFTELVEQPDVVESLLVSCSPSLGYGVAQRDVVGGIRSTTKCHAHRNRRDHGDN